MTDNEIIKALEKLYDEAHKGYVTHLEHNGPRDTSHEEYIDLMSATLDLIQQQQEEIERLSNFVTEERCREIAKEYFQPIAKQTRAGTIKEFADRLNEKAFHDMNDGEAIVYCCDIDNIVKEMRNGRWKR